MAEWHIDNHGWAHMLGEHGAKVRGCQEWALQGLVYKARRGPGPPRAVPLPVSQAVARAPRVLCPPSIGGRLNTPCVSENRD